MKDSTEFLRFGTPATYRIRVQGHLDASYSDYLGGLAITQEKPHEETPVTILYGRLIDQGALPGVLNTLYDLRLPLLLVECVAIG